MRSVAVANKADCTTYGVWYSCRWLPRCACSFQMQN